MSAENNKLLLVRSSVYQGPLSELRTSNDSALRRSHNKNETSRESSEDPLHLMRSPYADSELCNYGDISTTKAKSKSKTRKHRSRAKAHSRCIS